MEVTITKKLEVPLVLPLQEDGHSCVPRCIKMILMYISSRLGGQTPDFSADKIAKIIDTDDDGTLLENVRKLNTHRAVRRLIPSLEFEIDYKMHKFSEIIKEIKSNRPVIAWVKLSDGIHSAKHAVVITCVDREKDKIYFNDPMFGEVQEDISSFLSRWESVDRILIKVKIGKRIQRLLDEYINKEETTKVSNRGVS